MPGRLTACRPERACQNMIEYRAITCILTIHGDDGMSNPTSTISRVQLHADGPEVSRIVPGMMRLHEWDMDDHSLVGWINECLEMGVTTFDHADIYGGYTNEERFGKALKLDPSLREQIEIVTKCGIMLVSDNRPNNDIKHYDTSEAHIIASAEHSLKMFDTDYLDVLLLHRPDPLMDGDAIASAFSKLRQAGKVKHFGVSNFTPSQWTMLQAYLDFPLVTNQIECSVRHMQPLQDGTLDQCQAQRIAPMAWSPLGGGRIFAPTNEREAYLQQTLQKVGDELGQAALDQVAIAWLLKHPATLVPVLGTGRIERIRSAVAAARLAMTRQQWFRIWQASAGHEVP